MSDPLLYNCQGRVDMNPRKPRRSKINKAQMAADFATIPDPGLAAGLTEIRNADRLRDAIALLRDGERAMGNEERVRWKRRVGAYLSLLPPTNLGGGK